LNHAFPSVEIIQCWMIWKGCVGKGLEGDSHGLLAAHWETRRVGGRHFSHLCFKANVTLAELCRHKSCKWSLLPAYHNKSPNLWKITVCETWSKILYLIQEFPPFQIPTLSNPSPVFYQYFPLWNEANATKSQLNGTN